MTPRHRVAETRVQTQAQHPSFWVLLEVGSWTFLLSPVQCECAVKHGAAGTAGETEGQQEVRQQTIAKGGLVFSCRI